MDLLTLPPELAVTHTPVPGTAPFSVVLIAANCGYQPSQELRLYEVLRKLHEQLPTEWLFAWCDPNHLYLTLTEEEADVGPYRAFPDRDITAGIAEMMVRDGHTTAACGFAIVSQPAVHFQGYDDWYGRALARESLLLLDSSSAKTEIAFGLLDDAARRPELASVCAEGIDLLKRLARLNLTAGEWMESRRKIDQVLGHAPAELSAALRSARQLADSFYDGMSRRVQALVAKACDRMSASGARWGIILTDIHWLKPVSESLQARSVSHCPVVVAGAAPGSYLDATASLLDVDLTTPLEDLFSGRKQRTLAERVAERGHDLAQLRANEWAYAAQAYLARYERFRRPGDRAEGWKCLETALSVSPDHLKAGWLKAVALNQDGDRTRALAQIDGVIRRAPRDSSYAWTRSTILAGMGRWKEEQATLRRALWVNPRNGTLWNALGVHLYNRERPKAACYCFQKGAEHKCAKARTNLQRVCPNRVRWFHSPIAVLPSVLWAMNRIVLPIYHGWDDARLNAAMGIGVAAAVAGACHGGWAGWRAAGLLGACGGTALLGLSYVLFWSAICVYIITAQSAPTRLGRLASAMLLLLFAGAGAALSSTLALAVAPPTWDPLAKTAALLLGAVLPAAGIFIIGNLPSKRNPPPAPAG